MSRSIGARLEDSKERAQRRAKSAEVAARQKGDWLYALEEDLKGWRLGLQMPLGSARGCLGSYTGPVAAQDADRGTLVGQEAFQIDGQEAAKWTTCSARHFLKDSITFFLYSKSHFKGLVSTE